jgi:hypothetical protein
MTTHRGPTKTYVPSALLATHCPCAAFRDANVSFDEVAHRYTVSWFDAQENAAMQSVTQCINSMFRGFDADQAIGAIQASRAWRSGTHEFQHATPAEIKQRWDQQRDQGTIMHAYIEKCLDTAVTMLGHWPALDDREENRAKIGDGLTCVPMAQLQTLFQDLASRGYRPVRTEWVIFDDVCHLGGSVDAVFWNEPRQHFALFDWKRKPKFSTVPFSRQRDVGLRGTPVEGRPDCDVEHAALQLALYGAILRECYGLSVSELTVVVLHPRFGSAPLEYRIVSSPVDDTDSAFDVHYPPSSAHDLLPTVCVYESKGLERAIEVLRCLLAYTSNEGKF